MKVNVIGLDLAKNAFQAHGVDERGKAVLTKRLKRAEMAKFFAKLPRCLIGLEACASAHYWGRKLQASGHTVWLIMSKRGDIYLRTLLIHGVRAVINEASRRTTAALAWWGRLLERRHKNVATVALANKNARIVWALLTHDREYQAGYAARAA